MSIRMKLRRIAASMWPRNWRERSVALAAALFAALLTAVLLRWLDSMPSDWHLTSESTGHIATLFGVVVAGLWALYTTTHRRSLVARAKLKHRYQVWKDSNCTVLRVFIELTNSSEAMLFPGDGMTYVQSPPISPINPYEYAYETWTDIAAIRHASTYENLRIEPKETELYVHDVCIPSNVRYVQIYTWITCEAPAELMEDSRGDERPKSKIQIPQDDETWYILTLVDLEKFGDKSEVAATKEHSAFPGPVQRG
jgi:hypothetical protein